MGSSLQKIFQRRRNKARQIRILKNSLLSLPLLIVYTSLLFNFPQFKLIYLLFSLFSISINLLFYLNRRRNINFLYLNISIILFIQILAEFSPFNNIRFIYFPYLIFISYFFNNKYFYLLLLFFPLINIKNFLYDNRIYEEGIFIFSLLITGLISLHIKNKLKISETEKSSINKGLKTISSLDKEISIDDDILTYYLKFIFKPEEELKEILLLAKNTIFADSIHLLMNYGGILRLRCSTDENEKIIISDNGFIYNSLEDKKSYILSDIKEKNINIGIYKKTDIQSALIIPIIETNFSVGIILAESSRYHAFSSADKEILQKYTNQISKILQRERIYSLMHRSFLQIKVLHEESSKLLATLDTDIIIRHLLFGSKKIVQSNVIFLKPKGPDFILYENLNDDNEIPLEENLININNTLLEMIIKEKKPYYISDTKNFRTQILPYKMGKIKSAFIIPMFFERHLLGLLVALSENTNAFNTQQRYILELFANQATTSLTNAEFYKEIQQLAITDGLTGLHNHRYFQEKLSHEFKRYDRYKEPISILLIDIDYFKKINDTYGHQTGDIILKDVAKIIKKTVRDIDISARYGGEEFAVILIGTGHHHAYKIAERIRKNINQHNFNINDENIKISVSIGVSTFPDIAKTKQELFETADKALYKAKENGRNLVILWK